MEKKKRNIFSKDASVRDEEETSQKKQVQSQKGDLDYTPSEQKSTGVDTSWVTRERQKQFEERKNTQYVTTEEDGIKSHIPVTKNTDVPKTDLFDQVRYRMTLSDQEKEEFDKQISFSNRLKEVGEAYESPYLRSSQGNGDYSDKLDLEYDNPAWNNLTRDQKEHYMRLAKIENGDTEDTTDKEFDLYNALRYGDVDAEERYKNSLGNSGRNFTDMDDDYRMMEYATGIYAGYGGYDKDREQSLMWYSLPENVRNELTEGNVSPTTQAYLDNRFSDQAVKMFYKYGEKVRDYNEMQSLRETEEEFLGSNMLYATVIAPLQQAGADIASGFAAPRTMVNALVEGSSGYGVVNPYDSYMQKAAGAGEYVGQSIQSTLEERGDALGWLASKSYGVNMSAAESAMRMSLARGVAGFAVAKNPMASYDKVAAMAMNAMMGSSVVNQTLTQMINEGVPAEQAAQTAFARGLFECLFETVSLEKIGAFSQTPILKTATAKEFAKNLVKAGFTEGMEEVSTDLANDLYDMLMNYDYSDFEDFAKEHPDWDADTLRSEYIIKKIGDYAGSFLGGAVSGLTLGAISGGLAYNNVSNWANQGVSVNDADYARMASVVESVARQDGGVAETLKQMDEEGVDDVIRRGYYKTVVDAIEKNYSQAIDKATDVKQLDNVMENLNRQTNSVISQDIINKYNAKLVEFGKEGKVDYDTFIQNRDSNANTTFSELAFGNGESAIARNIRSDIDTVTEGFNAVAQESLLKKEALRKAAEAQARLEENNERVSTIIRNFAALGKDMDSPEVRKYANLIGIENSAKAYSEGKLASEETIKTSKNGSIASMTQEEINAEFGENAAHIVEYGDVIRGKKNYQLAYNIGQAITKMGINVRLYESDRNSKISNGFYKNGTIYLDINAGVSGVRSAIGETFSHELTHWIRANNESGYQSLLDFVKNELGDEFDKQVEMELGKLKKKDNNIAEEEVVANACARMLKNSETFKKYAIADMSGAQRILAKLREFVSNMKKAFQGSLGKVGERAADLISDMEGLQKEWEKALNDAIAETTALEAGIDMETYDDSVVRDAIRDTLEEKDKKGKPKGYDSWEDKVSAMLQEKLGIDKATADKYIRDEQSIASMIFDNIGFLDYKPDDRYEAIKKNSDYPQGTVDLTNLCRKRAIFTEIFDSLQEAFPDKLFNAMDIAEIRQVLKDHGYQVACALCFVEDRRQRVGEIADNFIERLKLAKGGALTVVNSKGQTKTLTMTKDLAKQDVSQRAGFKYGDVIKVTDKYIPTQYDLITYDGFKELSQNHPQVASAFIRANNYLGMSSARLVEGRAEYKRQILDYTPAQVKRINNKGGLRIFSFSDFEAVHLLDICQVITDAAAVGLKIQAYTKVPEFAKLVANTGIKLNRSLIPFGVRGYEVLPDGSRKLKYDTTEGIDINHKDFFDSSDNPNIGNILVGINDEHIRLAMLDDFVDYIIPFHTNQGKNVLAVKGISAWQNYKEYQRERYIDGRKGARDVNIYTQVIDKYNPKNKVEFVNAFLKECKAQKKIPRFDQFLNKVNGEYVYTPGYEKLLLDFKLFDKQGNILPQTTVNPNIDMDTAKNILADEVKNAESRVHVSKQIIKELENKYETRHAARDSEGNELSEAQQEYFADSKVRDENGNLKVMRHGSEHAGFTVFNPEFSDDNRSLFFTDDPSVAKTYSGSYEAFSPSKHYSFDDLNNLISNATGGENYIVNDNGTYKLMEAGFIGQEDNVVSESTNIDDIRDTFMDEYLSNLEGESGNYEVYLNITNPLVVDANNSYWDEIEVDWSDELQTTRTLAEKAANEGYDGVIVNNVIDTAIYGTSEEKHRVSNIAIAFNSNQVKDVNNTNPTENEDIRYSVRTLDDGTQYVYLDGDRFLREDGTEMNEKEAYETIVGTKITLPDGDEITFVKNLPHKKRMFKELFHRLPYNEGVNDINALNKEINQNIVEAYQNSSSVLKNDKDRDGKHSIYGIDSFDTRRVIIADDNAAYDLELTIANLNDGRKIAYAKRSAKANDDIWNKIKKEAKVDKSHKSQPSNKTISQSPIDVKRNAQRDSDRTIDEINDDYMNAVSNGNERLMQKYVAEAARLAGYTTPKLFHGTRFFGWTRYKDDSHKTPFIYTSTDSTVSANYAGDNHYAAVRKVAKGFKHSYNIDDVISNAESVYDTKYHVATDEERQKAYDALVAKAIELADKADELYPQSMYKLSEKLFDENNNLVANSFLMIPDMFFAIRDGDVFGKQSPEWSDDTEEKLESLKSDFENYESYRNGLREWFMEHRDEVTDDQKKYIQFLLSYEVGDALIDLNYGLSRVLHDGTIIAREKSDSQYANPLETGFAIPEDLQDAMEQIHNIGSYELYGKLGDNPLEFDANGAQFWALKVPQMGDDEYHSTDKVCEWAVENGYTSVIMHNIYDYGNKADNYVFFSPEQVKSADPVTYDDNGDVIPLSERFNSGKDDIRYSARDIANSESEMLVNALKTDSARASDTTSRYSLEQYAKEYNGLREMERESIKLAKELKKASPSQREVLTKKILRLDRQILKATEKLTEMRTQRVISDILVNEWSKRLADVEWTNELTYQKTKKALEERYGRSIRDLRQKNKQQKQDIRDRYEINKRKKNIEKKAKEIMNRILHPTEKKHIPSILINPIVEMLDSIDYWTPAVNKKATKKSESMRERFMSFREAVNKYQKEIDEGAEMTEYMFDPEFLETVDELCESVKGIDDVNDMGVEDIVKLDQTLTELNHLIARGNKMITASHYATINDAVTDSYDELSKLEDVKKAKGNLYQRLNAGMSDSYAFGQYAGRGAANIIDMLSKAFEKKITQIKEGKEFAENLLKDKDTKSWSKDKIAFKTERGDTIELTVAQMMELYLLNKREQARGHIYGGGINIEDKKGKFRKAVKVTESDVNQVIRYLKNVPGAIEVADALQNFGATVVTGWGNEASNLLYGISKFTDPDYWQIRSDSASLKANQDSEAQANASMFKLQNLGRTKAVKKNANNALYVGDVFDTFAKTIDEMSSYGSILPATTDAMRWYNSSVAVDDETRVRIKAMLQNKLGTDMAKVFTDTIRALNGGVLGTDSLESLVKVMTGRAKAAAVAGNLRVVLQQPTAYTRAFSVIPAKYLLRALTMKPASAEAQEHSPIAWHKAQGFYSNGLAPSLRKLIVGDQTVGESITEKALWLAGKADDITWGALWNASKLMVKDTTNLAEGSDAYWKKVNEIFSDIINKTQVVDTPLTKATWMRGNGVGIYFTAFMAEPTKTYSMVSTAVDRVLKHPKSQEARKALAIAGFTFGLNAIVNAFAQAIADAARDDDKEKDYFQKFGEQWKEDVLDNINPLTYVPVVKDAWSALNGYNNSRLDLQAIQNSVYAMNELKKIASGKSTKTLFGQVEQVSKAVSSWTGIPVSNVMRTMNSFGNLMGIDAFRRKEYTNTELARNIALSADAGNVEDYEKYTNQLTENLEKSGSSKSVDDYLSDYLAKNSEVIDEWAVKYYDDPTTLNDAIADLGEWYSPNVVVKAIKKSINQDAEDDDQKVSTSTSAGTIYNSGDINRMLKKGDIQTAQEIIDTIGDGYSEMGSSASPKTQITTYWKPIYQNASLAEKEEIRKMLYKLSYKGKQMYSAKDFEKWK